MHGTIMIMSCTVMIGDFYYLTALDYIITSDYRHKSHDNETG